MVGGASTIAPEQTDQHPDTARLEICAQHAQQILHRQAEGGMMITAHNTIRHLIAIIIATATIAIASMAFQANSIASSDAEELSAEERASLERQLDIAREERDALILETQGRIVELTETLENERAALATQRDELEAAKSVQADAEAQIAELMEALEAERATLAALSEELDAAKTDLDEAEAEAEEREQLERQLSIAREERDALVLQTEAQIAELTEALEDERAALTALRDELESTKSALAKAEADQPVNNLDLSQEDAADIGGQLTETGILVEFEPDELSFDSASAILPTTNLPTLDRIAKWLEDRPELNVRIEGHTDSLGSPEINQPLSQQRAEAVRQALIDRGIAAERVMARGAGSTQPIADNATPEGQRRNRRVEIYLMTAQEDKASAPSDAGD